MSNLSGALGMCVRARKCVFGFDSSLKSLKDKRSCLILLSNEASETTKKRMLDKCNYYNVDIVELDIEETLKVLNLNDNTRIISINDINFKKLIYKKLKGDI